MPEAPDPLAPEIPMHGLSAPEHSPEDVITLEVPLDQMIPENARKSFKDAPPLQPTVKVKGPDGQERILAQGSYDHQASERARRASEAIVKKMQARRRVQSGRPEYDSSVISYIECKKSDCLGPGIWIHGDPFAVLKDENWESSYHNRGAYWTASEAPFCQCCFARTGSRHNLQVFFASSGPVGREQKRVGFAANPRFVRTMTQDEYNQLVGGTAQEVQHA